MSMNTSLHLDSVKEEETVRLRRLNVGSDLCYSLIIQDKDSNYVILFIEAIDIDKMIAAFMNAFEGVANGK